MTAIAIDQNNLEKCTALAHAIDSSDVLALGEIHGIRECYLLTNAVIKLVSQHRSRVLVFLELPFFHQPAINDFMLGKISDQLLIARCNIRGTASSLSGPISYLETLRSIHQSTPNGLSVKCVDIVHNRKTLASDSFSSHPLADRNREIVACGDEDEFDAQREEFIYQQTLSAMKETEYECLFYCFGNMHTSQSDWYFPVNDVPECHIDTFTSRLRRQQNMKVFSTLFFALYGKTCFQGQGALPTSRFDNSSGFLAHNLDFASHTPGTIHYTELSDHKLISTAGERGTYFHALQESYNGVFSVNAVEADVERFNPARPSTQASGDTLPDKDAGE